MVLASIIVVLSSFLYLANIVLNYVLALFKGRVRRHCQTMTMCYIKSKRHERQSFFSI